MLPTETPSERHAELDRGGRLIYVGAGTSGRLGVLDSVELQPTFSWPRARALALLAGGLGAGFRAVEGAEDDRCEAAAELRALAVGHDDVVFLISASGSTPYVLGALPALREAQALVIAIVNNPGTPLAAGADLTIALNTGSELISGSTRLTAGTAQKIVLNTLSSTIMVRLHKVHGNLMVDLQATNAKLRRRALRLTMQATGADEVASLRALQACGFRVKAAIVVLLAGVDAPTAESRLDAAGGSVRAALGEAD
jgi:N-acetylmuramic acid 6-phosphate etherase